MNSNSSIRLAFVFAVCAQQLLGQATDSVKIDLSPRATGGIGYFISLGVGGLRMCGKYHTTDKSAIEAGYGVIPLLGLFGKQAKVFSVGANYYARHDWVGTPVISFLAVYDNIRTTSGFFEEDLYFLSPMAGIDFLYQSGFNWYLRAGGLLRLGHQRSPVGLFCIDLGFGWEFF